MGSLTGLINEITNKPLVQDIHNNLMKPVDDIQDLFGDIIKDIANNAEDFIEDPVGGVRDLVAAFQDPKDMEALLQQVPYLQGVLEAYADVSDDLANVFNLKKQCEKFSGALDMCGLCKGDAFDITCGRKLGPWLTSFDVTLDPCNDDVKFGAEMSIFNKQIIDFEYRYEPDNTLGRSFYFAIDELTGIDITGELHASIHHTHVNLVKLEATLDLCLALDIESLPDEKMGDSLGALKRVSCWLDKAGDICQLLSGALVCSENLNKLLDNAIIRASINAIVKDSLDIDLPEEFNLPYTITHEVALYECPVDSNTNSNPIPLGSILSKTSTTTTTNVGVIGDDETTAEQVTLKEIVLNKPMVIVKLPSIYPEISQAIASTSDKDGASNNGPTDPTSHAPSQMGVGSLRRALSAVLAVMALTTLF